MSRSACPCCWLLRFSGHMWDICWVFPSWREVTSCKVATHRSHGGKQNTQMPKQYLGPNMWQSEKYSKSTCSGTSSVKNKRNKKKKRKERKGKTVSWMDGIKAGNTFSLGDMVWLERLFTVSLKDWHWIRSRGYRRDRIQVGVMNDVFSPRETDVRRQTQSDCY